MYARFPAIAVKLKGETIKREIKLELLYFRNIYITKKTIGKNSETFLPEAMNPSRDLYRMRFKVVPGSSLIG